MDLGASMAPDKPFFDMGLVETVVTQSQSGEKHSTDEIMMEVQEEETFKRLIAQLQSTLHVQDRIFMRVPYYKVRQNPKP